MEANVAAKDSSTPNPWNRAATGLEKPTISRSSRSHKKMSEAERKAADAAAAAGREEKRVAKLKEREDANAAAEAGVNAEAGDGQKPKQQRNDIYRASWLDDEEFQGVFEEVDGIVYCKECKRAGCNNIFGRGKRTTDTWRRRNLHDHMHAAAAYGNDGHNHAVKYNKSVSAGAQRLRLSREKALEAAKLVILNIMTVVYWLVLEDIAMGKCPSACLMLSCLGVATVVGGKGLYNNHVRAREMVMCLSKVIKGKQWTAILKSPVVGICVDESTDISASENLVIYITYVADGRARTEFLGLVHAPDTSAEALFNQIKEYLELNGLQLSRVVCFCSDGASVMTGHENGVAARLKGQNPFMLAYHCIAHRLALACADSAQDVDYPDEEEAVVNEISSYFNRSSKRTGALAKVCTESWLLLKLRL